MIHTVQIKEEEKKITTNQNHPKKGIHTASSAETMRMGLEHARHTHKTVFDYYALFGSHMQVHEFHDSRLWIQNKDRALGKWLKKCLAHFFFHLHRWVFFFFLFLSFGITLKKEQNKKKRKLLKLKRN